MFALPRIYTAALFPHFNKTQYARLAQSVERETLNLKVVGSTPTSGSIPVHYRPSLFWTLPCLVFLSFQAGLVSVCVVVNTPGAPCIWQVIVHVIIDRS
ncbi:hypothetical protein B0H66DRAFT_567580 [Apodospora peruviana]|uniref:Uncharacterized protein n=1 Tax=Apodospora peruviana TaxID=516989 RepID=A0AAE0HW85_9PEZI|nr:hypothetical protein B0H66DRAFT_567580 [Apodospora peruviana]